MIDLSSINEGRVRPSDPKFEFEGEMATSEGLAMGSGPLWVTNDGDATMRSGQGNGNNSLEIVI